MTFIYALLDPRNNECRYIGKTIRPERRLKEHVRHCARRNNHAHIWVRSLVKSNILPEMLILESCVSCWEDSEKWWIGYMRMLGARLTNSTPGGDGRQRGVCYFRGNET